MKNKKIYTSRPLSYRQWGAIKKEMYRLVFAIAGIVVITSMIDVLAKYLIHVL